MKDYSKLCCESEEKARGVNAQKQDLKWKFDKRNSWYYILHIGILCCVHTSKQLLFKVKITSLLELAEEINIPLCLYCSNIFTWNFL